MVDLSKPSITASKIRKNHKEYSWYDENGLRHREDGPAWILMYGSTVIMKLWYIHGKRHREDGPAYIEYDKKTKKVIQETWYLDDIRDRHGEYPTEWLYVDANNTCKGYFWYKKGLFHRFDGPENIIEYDDGRIEVIFWKRHGKNINKEMNDWIKKNDVKFSNGVMLPEYIENFKDEFSI